jgi:hypothetical protein
MFLSKLLVRIRGELLNLREQFAEKEEMRLKAEDLLNRIEAGMGDSLQGQRGQDTSRKITICPEKIGDLEKEFNELLEQRKADQSPTTDQSPGNSRTLG